MRGGTPYASQTFSYTTGVAVEPAFGTDSTYSGVTTTQLSGIAVPVAGSYTFTYDAGGTAGASELTKAVFPWGGNIEWSYASATYSGSRLLREVNNRYMNPLSSGGTEIGPYPITHSDTGTTIAVVHADSTLADASGVGAKKWTFINSGSTAWEIGLVSEFDQKASVSGATITSDAYTWSQTPTSLTPYISQKVSVKDSTISATTTQTLDQYGNTTQTVVYPYVSVGSGLPSPLATYNSTYLTTSSYISAYLMSLPVTTTVTPAGLSPITLASNTYDGCNTWPYPYGSPAPTYNFDPGAVASLPVRGYLSASTTPAGSSGGCYYWWGVPYSSTGIDGTTTTSSVSSATDYTAPDTITTPTYSNALSYNAWLGLTSTTGANGETLSMTYDSVGRPATGTSPYGAVTYYAYSSSGTVPVWQTQTGPNGFTRTTLDGFGRTILVERGPSSSTITSKVDSVYAPCACSPLGKLQKVSQPYAPGGTAVWTTYSYDGIGRTLSIVKPDGASTATYSYFSGNQTSVTDPAGNWKTFVTDVSGNLITVAEPDPGGGSPLVTSYAYDWMNHLTTTSMTRSSTTQTRSFVYNTAGQLTSVTNPENGTVSYSYNSDTTLYSKTDAKGQVTVYTYDSKKRPTMVQIYPSGLSYSEDICQRVTYGYDSTTPAGPGSLSGSYLTGRLSWVTYGAPYGAYMYTTCSGTPGPTSYGEYYSYNAPGGVTTKQFAIGRPYPLSGGWTSTAYVNLNYTYSSAGQQATMQQITSTYGTEVTYTTSYDSMGRPLGMTDDSSNTWTQNAAYDAAGRRTSLQMLAAPTGSPYYQTEANTFNVNGQLTEIQWSAYTGTSNVQYGYSGTANNGQITSMTYSSGETISYTYDSLKRLTYATSTASWYQNFAYDGFGSLTSKTLNGGSNTVPTINAANNQFTGGTYDYNGNMTTGLGMTVTYDERNRLASASPTSGGTEYYGYAPSNKRIYRWTATGSEEWYIYGLRGEKLGTFSLDDTGSGYAFTARKTNVWFAGKLVNKQLPAGAGYSVVARDRLGSNLESGSYYPYGEDRTSTANDTEKFGTYVRDGFTGMDYADQRYYASSYGRFNTADRLAGSAMAGDPGSWNRYSYAGGDPVNRNDPSGMLSCASWYYYMESEGEYDGSNDGALGNCGPGLSNATSDFDPCSVNPELLDGSGQSCDAAPPCYLAENSVGCGGGSGGGGSAQDGGGGGGGGGGGINIRNWTSTSAAAIGVQNTLRWIQAQIAAYPTCDHWLSGSFDTINTILGQTPQNQADLVGVGNFSASGTTVTNALAGVGGSSLTNGALLTVNLDGAYFNSGVTVSSLAPGITGGSYQAQLFILLHELAHLTVADGFQSGDSAADIQNANNGLLLNNCADFIASVPNSQVGKW